MWKSILISTLFCVFATLELAAQETQDSCIIYVPKSAVADGDCFDCHTIRIGTDCDFTEFEFLLFDRWGTVVFESKDPAFEYDPSALKEAIYTYQIKSKTQNGNLKKQTGSIYVLK